MTTTCLTSSKYSWWSINKWITNWNNQHCKLNHLQYNQSQHYQHNKNRSTNLYLILLIILVLVKSSLTDNQLRAPIIIEQPVDVTVRRNDPATLNCKTEGYPPPTIEWFKDGIKIRPSKNPMILPAGSLFFFQVDQKNADKFHNSDKQQNSDTGIYWCEATNRIGKTRSRNATLSLAMLNHNFQLEPQNLSLPAGQMAIFHCLPPRGLPTPKIYWKKDDQIVRAVFNRVQQLTNGSLIVNEVRKSDEGRFVCVAENMLGIRESTFATLTVYVKPNFVQPPEDVIAKIGDRIRFQCIVDGDPRPNIDWRKENGQLPGNRVEIDPQDNSLIINNVEQSDDGFYYCEASNLIGNSSSGAALIVHSAPTFQVVPSDITASLNGVAKLPCAVIGNPTPNLFWSKEGNQALLFPGNSNGRFTVTQSGHLTITDLQIEDTGFYVCSAVSVVGSAMAKAHIKVTSAFEGPPPIIRYGPANQTLPTDTIALLFCEVIQPNNLDETGQTILKVKVNWLKNGKSIIDDSRFVQLDSGTLQINNLQTNDTGTYTCVASYNEEGNRLGQSKKEQNNLIQSELPSSNWSATLTVFSPRNPNIAFYRQPEFSSYPTAPFRPVIINFTNTEITVSWRKVQEIGSSPLIGYRLEYYDADSPKPTWVLASNRIFTEIYTVKHLQPNTRYVFQVRAENSHGLSAPSQLSNVVQTLKFAPNRLNQLSNHQKNLDEIRSHLNGMQVILKDAKSMSANSIKLTWELIHTREQKINKDNIEGYYIRFRDVGPDLDELQNDLKLLNKPSLAKMTNSEHQKYNMLTVLTSSGSNVNSYVINDLSEFTLYELFVVPFYRSVDGAPSNSKMIRTLADLPSAPPAEVKAHLLNLTAISVHWKPVPKPQRNGIIQAYNVMLIPIQLANTTTFGGQASININNQHNSHLFNSQLPSPHYLDPMISQYASSNNNNQPPSSLLFNNIGSSNSIEHHNLMNIPGHQSPSSSFLNSPHPNTQNSPIFSPIDYQDNDLSSAALLSRNAPIFSTQNLNHQMNEPRLPIHNSPSNFHLQQQFNALQQQTNLILLNQLSRNITTNSNTHQLVISDLQPGAIYQLRIAAGNMVGYGPASVPILLQMTSEYIIEGVDHEDLDGTNGNSLENGTRRQTSITFNRNLFNSKIMTIIFTVCLAGLLIGAVCFVINRRSQNLNKYDKSNSSVLNKTKFAFASTNTSKQPNKLANDLFSNSNHPMMINACTDSLTSPNDALWIDRNWLAATQNSQTADFPLLKNDSSTLLGGLNSRTDHHSTSSAIYASTSQLNCSRPSINNPSNGEYCALQSQNDYAEVSELSFTNPNSKLDSKNLNSKSTIGFTLNNIGSSKLSANSNGVLMPSNAYATTTLINLKNQGENFHCQNSMLYEHNSSIEPTSSTLLLQRTPSENGSYTTDEYSYRRNNGGVANKQLKNQTIERKKKANYTNNNYNGTLCSKSSTASSQISDHSKASTIQQSQQLNSNKSNIFSLNELQNNIQMNSITQQHDQESPPPPAPNHPFNQNSSQRIFTTNINNNQNQSNNFNVYESTYDASLYGGINRVQLGNRQHHTLNTRQLNQQQQRKNQSQRPINNKVLDFIELDNDLNNHQMNLISNPLHLNNNLQGSLPSLVNNQELNNGQSTNAQSMIKKILSNRINQQLRTNSQLNSQINQNSNLSDNDESSDNFYCDIEEAQRVQSDFRAKLNNQQQNYATADSGDENVDDLISENDKLINNDENKLIVRHRRLQDEYDEDQYSDYESIDRLTSSTNSRFTTNTNGFLRPTFNSGNFNSRLTPTNLNNTTESNKSARQFNSNLARKNQQHLNVNNQFSNSQPGLFRFNKDNGFNTMQTNNRMR